MQNIRLNEYKVLLYRIFLVYVFYTISRLLFVAFNKELLQIESIGQLLRLCLYGLKFDTTIILYTNSLFIVLSLRSEEHTSELQSRPHLVCRLLLEKKKTVDTMNN